MYIMCISIDAYVYTYEHANLAYTYFLGASSHAGVTLAAAGLVAAAAVTRRARRAKGTAKGPVMVGASVAAEELLGSRP